MDAAGNCRSHSLLHRFDHVDTVWVMGNTVYNRTAYPGRPQFRMRRSDYGAYNS